MKKFLISAIFVVGFGSYAIYNYYQTNSAAASAVTAPITTTNASSGTFTDTTSASSSAPPTDTNTNTTNQTAPAAKTVTAAPVTTPVTTKKSTGQYTDGTYTGTVADAYYGNVQVKAVISGGALTNVVFLQSPNDRSTSVAINRQAMPVLTAEAIQAQSANVNGVSGASDTSAAFEESLASALSAAKA